MKIIAVEDKIVVEMMKKEEKTEGGLIIPETAQGPVPQSYGKVISSGPKNKGYVTGDIIMFHQQAGMDIMIGKKVLKVLASGEVYAIIREEEQKDG